jgi:hypothetical protein
VDVNTRQPDQRNDSTSSGGGGRPTFGEFAAEALRFWEPRRLIYNGVLLVVVCVHFYIALPGSKASLAPDPMLTFFALAVLANVAYCAAYVADIFVQFSGLRPVRGRWRWLLLIIGTAFAAVVTHFFIMDLLADGARG